MRFTKMHGAGNDFIIINNIEEKLPRGALPALAKRLCAAHTGAGGRRPYGRGERAAATTPCCFFNSDGSEGEMCGNGARCIARYGYEHGLAGETQNVETVSGTVTGRRITPTLYRVRLNDPSLMDLHRPSPSAAGCATARMRSLACPACRTPSCSCRSEDMDRGALLRWAARCAMRRNSRARERPALSSPSGQMLSAPSRMSAA